MCEHLITYVEHGVASCYGCGTPMLAAPAPQCRSGERHVHYVPELLFVAEG